MRSVYLPGDGALTLDVIVAIVIGYKVVDLQASLPSVTPIHCA